MTTPAQSQSAASGQSAHTPLPWSVNGPQITAQGDMRLVVAVVLSGMDRAPYPDASAKTLAQRDANAALILRAVNAHESLVSSLSALLEEVTGPAEVYGDGRGSDGKKTGLSYSEFNARRNERIASARSALTLARKS